MTFFKRVLGAAAVSTLLASSAIAAQIAPLPAGKPAGTKEAALVGYPALLIGLAVVAAVIAISVSGNDDNKSTTPTTSTSGTGA